MNLSLTRENDPITRKRANGRLRTATAPASRCGVGRASVSTITPNMDAAEATASAITKLIGAMNIKGSARSPRMIGLRIRPAATLSARARASR